MRYLVPVILLLALSINACGAAATPTASFSGEETNPTEVALAVEATLAARATETTPAETPDTAVPEATATPEQTATAATEEPEESTDLLQDDSVSGCAVQPITDIIPLAPDPVIPAVQTDEWILGGEEASITLIEYSDFQ